MIKTWYRIIDGVEYEIIGRISHDDQFGTFLLPGASWWENKKMVRQFIDHSLYFFTPNWTEGVFQNVEH